MFVPERGLTCNAATSHSTGIDAEIALHESTIAPRIHSPMVYWHGLSQGMDATIIFRQHVFK